MENIARYIASRYKHDGLFSNIIKNWKDHHGTVKTFQILNLPPLLDICKVSADEKDFWKILLRIERAVVLRWMDAEASNFQVSLSIYGSFQKLVRKIGIRNWNLNAISIFI